MRTANHLWLLLLVAGTARAQTADTTDPLAAHIGVIARATGDSIVVRWGVSNVALWRAGNESGYVVERSSGDAKNFTTLATIKPWPAKRFQSLVESRNISEKDSTPDFAAVAYSLLYDSASVSLDLENGTLEDAKAIRDKNASLEMSRTFALMAADRDAEAAAGLGLRFVDHNVQRGERYTYRVRLAGPLRTYHADAGVVTIENVPYDKSRSAIRVTGVDGDGRIGIVWPSTRHFGSYFVERSDNNGKSFSRLTLRPIVTLRPGPMTATDSESYLDTTIVNYRPYVYRIYGTTSFGDVELAGEARAMGRDMTPPTAPLLYQPKQTSDHAIEVKWLMHEPVERDLVGFRVMRGETDSGAFITLADNLAPSARLFTDTHFSDTVHNYYVIEAFDTARNVSRSFAVYAPLMDTTPPAAPTWLSGLMDTNGVVTLTLKGNTERDLMGYRLLRANSPEHEFSVIQESYADPDAPEARRSVYHDTVTLRSLTPYVYYRAIALDRNYNESGLSPVIAVPRPDRIPPVPPVITATNITDSNVTIEYIASSSEDVRTQLLLRREPGKDWATAVEIGAGGNHVADNHVVQNTEYEYAMQAVDSTGNRSKFSGIVSARPYHSSLADGVRDLKAAVIDSGYAVQLTWTSQNATSRLVLYRGIANQPVAQYTSLPAGTSQFSDKNVTRGLTYTYAIKAFDPDGGESRLSDKVKAELK